VRFTLGEDHSADPAPATKPPRQLFNPISSDESTPTEERGTLKKLHSVLEVDHEEDEEPVIPLAKEAKEETEVKEQKDEDEDDDDDEPGKKQGRTRRISRRSESDI
jgi:hypothetical protein